MSDNNFNKECPWCEEDTMERFPSGMVECSNGCGYTNYFDSDSFDKIGHCLVFSMKRRDYDPDDVNEPPPKVEVDYG